MPNFIYSQEAGEGPVVVLIAGLGGLAAFWEPVVELLRSDYRVIVFDHPGVGRSAIDGAPTIPGIAAALLEVLDQRDVQRAHLVGHSTGSLVAQTMALDHPERVTSLVLSSGWAKPDRRFEDFFAYRKFLLKQLGGTAYNAFTRLVAYPSDWYGAHFAEQTPPDFAAPSALDVEMTDARMNMLLNYSRREQLPSLRLPVRVIGAPDDYIIAFHHAQELARLIPGADLVELSGGHFAPVTRTPRYIELLRQFWEAQP